MRYALKKLTSQPEATFITLDDIKSHSRIDTDDDDATIQMMLLAVQDWVEEITGRTLTQTQYRMTFDCFPCGNQPIALPRCPIISLDIFTYIDITGTQQNLAITGPTPDVIFNVTGREPERVAPVYNTCWPQTQHVIDACQITFTAGFIDDGDSKVAALKLIMCKMVAAWYEFREPVAARLSVQQIPGLAAFEALLGSYIIYGFGA